MKICVIGDIHGRTIWEDIVKKEKDSDKIIFVGDYMDSHDSIGAQQQIDNFKNIIEYKKANPSKVILLFGNHDYHYLRTSKFQYSGFQYTHKFDIQELLHKALDEDLMQMCFIHDNFIFTHAGVTKTWCLSNNIDISNKIDNQINDLFKFKPNVFEFTAGEKMDMYGDDITQTPIWVRPHSLYKDKLDGFYHVVGHTTVNQIKFDPKFEIILIDSLGTSKQYLSIEDKNVLIKQI